VAEVSRLLRGTLPVLVASAVAMAFALPANAAPAVSAPQAATPSLAGQWWLTSLHVPQAWRTATSKGAGITVAVLSTGVSSSHRDLSGEVLTGPDYAGSGRVAGGPYWGSEGTAVAGLIAGHGHGAGGASGSTGIAPRARILSVPVTLEYDDPLNSDATITRRLPDAIAAGIRYAVGHGARVIALPIDPGTLGLAGGGDPAAAGGSPAERAAVAYAVAHDVVLVAPTGDNGAGAGTLNYPAAYPGVLAVGATTRNGQLASFSNKGSHVALTAPGAGLTVAAPGGGYGTLASTDMSAALAAGVAALIRSRFPGLNAAAVTQAMERGVTGRAAPGAGHGALDAAGALAAAAVVAARQAPQPTATPTAPPSVTYTARGAATPGAARSGAGILAGSLLRDAVIVLGALIAALAAALAAYGSRRRRAAAARQPRGTGQGGVHARRPRAALPAAGQPRNDNPWAGPRPPGAVNGPRLTPPPPAGALGNPGRPRRARRGETGEPPWEPARPPGTVPPAAAADDLLPPWELATGLAAAPVSPDVPELPVASTGSMYVWNPSASGPLPILREDEEDQDRLIRTGPCLLAGPAIFAGEPGLHVRRVQVHVLLSRQLTDRAHHLVGDSAPRPGRRLARQVTEVHPLADPDLDLGRPGQRRARRQHLPRAHHRHRDHGSARVQRQVADP
jgi:subtilisin family serine protease